MFQEEILTKREHLKCIMQRDLQGQLKGITILTTTRTTTKYNTIKSFTEIERKKISWRLNWTIRFSF